MPEDTLNARDLAERYGFAYAMIKSHPRLYGLFKKAVANNWDQGRIMTEVRATDWYKRNSESQRNEEALRASDPATWRQGLNAQRVRVRMMMAEFGARMQPERLDNLARSAYSEAWDDNQLRRVMSQYVRFTDGRLLGQAGAMESEWREYAGQMGVRVNRKQLQNWARAAIGGSISPQDVLSRIKETAQSKYPALSRRIDQGETVESIAQPYVQAYADLLEQNPTAVDFTQSGLIQRALQDKNQKGDPRVMSVWEFEQKVRGSEAWKSTNNAQDSMMEVAHKVLQDFGLSD